MFHYLLKKLSNVFHVACTKDQLGQRVCLFLFWGSFIPEEIHCSVKHHRVQIEIKLLNKAS